MLSNGVFVIRDFYDIAAASVIDPISLADAINLLSQIQRWSIRDEIRRFPPDWANSPSSGRPIIRASRPEALARDPAMSLQVVDALLDSDWTLSDELKAGAPGPQGEEGPGGLGP